MLDSEIKKLRALTGFPALIEYLRDELGWPIEAEGVDDITFNYAADELDIDPQHAVKIESPCKLIVRELTLASPSAR